MRYIMYGAGAIGGIIGSKLHLAGHEVILIARGEHLRLIQQNGLVLRVPDGEQKLPIPAVSHPSEIEFRPDDVVVLTMKSQDTAKALDDLRAAAGDQAIVVSGQNGIENERMALRMFAKVYGLVLLDARDLPRSGRRRDARPGRSPASATSAATPPGTDDVAEAIARDFDAAGVASIAREDIMNWKYTKLLQNVANAVGAVCGSDGDTSDLQDMVRNETRECFRAAGYVWIPGPQLTERGALFRPPTPSGISAVGPQPRRLLHLAEPRPRRRHQRG